MVWLSKCECVLMMRRFVLANVPTKLTGAEWVLKCQVPEMKLASLYLHSLTYWENVLACSYSFIWL